MSSIPPIARPDPGLRARRPPRNQVEPRLYEPAVCDQAEYQRRVAPILDWLDQEVADAASAAQLQLPGVIR